MTVLLAISILVAWIAALGGMIQGQTRVIDGIGMAVLATSAGTLVIVFPRNSQALQGALVLMVAFFVVFGRHMRYKMERRRQ